MPRASAAISSRGGVKDPIGATLDLLNSKSLPLDLFAGVCKANAAVQCRFYDRSQNA